MKYITKSLFDLLSIKYLTEILNAEFWKEILIMLIVIFFNCVLIPLVKKLYTKLNLGKENEEKLDEKLDEIDDKFNDLTKKNK